MYFAIFTLTVLATAVNTVAKSPPGPPPSGCSPNYPNAFEIVATGVPMIVKRQDSLVITLNNGVLTDSEGRTGYIASNNQLQFDNPPQENAIYTSGFSVCSNGSLALGDTALWWKCQSGNFYNLYNSDIAAQCTPALIDLSGVTTIAATATTTTAPVPTSSAGEISTTGTSSTATTAPVQMSSAGLVSTTGTSNTTTTAPVQTSSASLISTTGTSVTATTTATPSSSKSTGIAMSLHAGDAMVALAGFAAVALL